MNVNGVGWLGRLTLLTIGTASLPLIASAQVPGGAIDINATSLSLSAAHSSGVIQLANHRDLPDVIQVRTYAWKRNGTANDLTPTNEIIGLPAVFTLPASGFQAIRIGLRGPMMVDPTTERTYRVFVSEVKPKDELGARRIGINVLMELDFPVFVAPAAPHRELSWAVNRVDARSIRLTATNKGNVHVRMRQVRISDASGQHAAYDGPIDGLLLAGESHAWILPVPNLDASEMRTIEASTEDGTARAELR